MFLNPCCKINLGLYVVEKRADGYHNLETVFYPIPLCDNLEVKTLHHSNEPYLLQTVGPKIQGNPEDNLIIKVYNQLLSSTFYFIKKYPREQDLAVDLVMLLS